MNIAAQQQEAKPLVPRPARYQVKLPVEVTHHAFVGTLVTQGVCTDLNEYGFGANIPQPLSVGEIVKVFLELPTDALNIYARVVYRNAHHYGFYFTEVEPEQEAKLIEALEFLQKTPKMTLQ